MPTYEYSCEKCGQFEVIQKITDPALTQCPNCGSPVQRLVSAPAFHLKGSGWYKTDYAGKGGASPSPSTSSSPATGDSSKAETTKSSDSSASSAGSTSGASSTTGAAGGGSGSSSGAKSE